MKEKSEMIEDFKKLLVQSLTDDMKDVIINQLDELLEAVSDEAYEAGRITFAKR